MPKVQLASFNLWGIDGKDVGGAVANALQKVGPQISEVIAVGFQEVWFKRQLVPILQGWIGDDPSPTDYTDVECHSEGPDGGSWKCLVPKAGSAGIPGRTLELGSGLALCVRGTVHDAFFTRFRGGYVPDRFAHKGLLAVCFTPPGLSRRALVNTHFHDYSNDEYGGARRTNIEQVAETVRWIDEHWRVPCTLVGDFNIDARGSYLDPEPTIDRTLYRNLLTVRKSKGRFWYDVNAQVHQRSPISTQANGRHAIDLHLLSNTEGKSDFAFVGYVFEREGGLLSDHKLVCSSWSES